MSWSRLCLLALMIHCVTVCCLGQGRRVQNAVPEIGKAYMEMSLAWENHDPDLSVKWLNPTLTLIDLHGEVTELNQTQQLAAARFDMRQNAGTKSLPRQTTVIDAMHLRGDQVTVTETTLKELTTVDPSGTVANVRFMVTSDDIWIRTSAGWRLSICRVTKFQQSADGSPSPAIAEALRSMRSKNQDTRSFDSGINFSNCMNADANQNLGYETRKAYCAPEH